MVLAAGRGTRMRHLSKARPKPLTVLAGRTLLDRVLDHLETAGVDRIVVNTHYMGEMITEHLSGRANIILSPEEVLLETGGGVRLALPHLGDDPFFVINSDAVWGNGPTPALQRLAAAVAALPAASTAAATTVAHATGAVAAAAAAAGAAAAVAAAAAGAAALM